eukprot:1007521-Rhodomonas_salina.1
MLRLYRQRARRGVAEWGPGTKQQPLLVQASASMPVPPYGTSRIAYAVITPRRVGPTGHVTHRLRLGSTPRAYA